MEYVAGAREVSASRARSKRESRRRASGEAKTTISPLETAEKCRAVAPSKRHENHKGCVNRYIKMGLPSLHTRATSECVGYRRKHHTTSENHLCRPFSLKLGLPRMGQGGKSDQAGPDQNPYINNTLDTQKLSVFNIKSTLLSVPPLRFLEYVVERPRSWEGYAF